MSEKINDGGPAFPHTVKNDDGTYFACVSGMSLRDWLAGQALISVTTRPYDNYANAARVSYALADAMLAARKGGDV